MRESGRLHIGGRERIYRLHGPERIQPGARLPVVLAFHGGGGDAAGMVRLSGLARLAARERFLAVFPEGVDRQWYDGREGDFSVAHRERVDDIGFIAALLDTLSQRYPIDPRYVFSTGLSNGALFCHYLAARLSSRIAAIAPVAGGIAEPFHREFAPRDPVSVLILQGVDDPLVPYRGGVVGRRRGRIVSTDEAIRLWTRHNGCRPTPDFSDLPDRDPTDGCRVRIAAWSGGRGGSEVALYRIEGGGHTWPGGRQYLPRLVIGNVCRDFDATEAIWRFFREHPRRPPAL